MNRLLAAAGVAVLAAGTGTLAYLALRPTDTPVDTVVPAEGGVVALAPTGTDALRWTGPAACTRNAATTVVERRTAISWQPVSVPLVTVDQISIDTGGQAVLLGRDVDCRRTVLSSSNGGVSWIRTPKTPPGVVALDLANGALWTISRPSVTAAYEVAVEGRVVKSPCGSNDGPPQLVSALDAKRAWVLCQGRREGQRMLARTINAGASWERRIDSQPGGIDSPGAVESLVFRDGPLGWIRIGKSDRCTAGELRITPDRGLKWAKAACVGGVVKIFDADFQADGKGILIGLKAGRLVVLETKDAGVHWLDDAGQTVSPAPTRAAAPSAVDDSPPPPFHPIEPSASPSPAPAVSAS